MRSKLVYNFLLFLILLLIHIISPTMLCVSPHIKQNEEYLGEFIRGQDKIRIWGRLLVVDNGESKPIVGATVELYANFSDGSWLFLGENMTDINGVFIFVVDVDSRFPVGEVIFTVYYSGDPLRGYEPIRAYYRAIIKAPPPSNAYHISGSLIIGLLLVMMILGALVSLRRISKHISHGIAPKTWLEVLDEIITKVSRKEFGFIMLTGKLIDALYKYIGKIPRASMTLQEKLLMIRDNLSDEAYNILKNMVSLYEIQLYGGPYARSILMNTLDYDTWKHLLTKLKEEFTSK